MQSIPDKINMFNMYLNGSSKIAGISGEIPLPDFEAMTETVNVAGGEMDIPTVGVFGPQEMEIPFTSMSTEMFSCITPADKLDLTLRASQQQLASQGIRFKGMRVVVRGFFKKMTSGKVKVGSGTGSSITLELTYILIEIDGKPQIELDKEYGVYAIGGVDILAAAKELC